MKRNVRDPLGWNRVRSAGWSAALILSLGAVLADDLALPNGRTLHDVSYSDPNPASVLVKSREGSERLDLVDLPAAVQQRFQFDPVTALRFLSAENRRLRGEASTTPGGRFAPALVRVTASASAETAWANRPPTPAAVSLPPVTRTSRVDAFDLVNHYRNEAASASARYKGHDFQLEGIVERVGSSIVGRGVKVLLESPDRGIRVVVEWRVPDDYPKFYTKAEGRRFFGGSGGAHRLVMAAGDRVRFSVRGGAYDDGAVFLGRAELLERVAGPSTP
jgi:hypothetical protein